MYFVITFDCLRLYMLRRAVFVRAAYEMPVLCDVGATINAVGGAMHNHDDLNPT